MRTAANRFGMLVIGVALLGAAFSASPALVPLLSAGAAEIPTELEFYLDCSPDPGIQATCSYPAGTTSVAVDVILRNNVSTIAIESISFGAVTDQQIVCDPPVGVSPPNDDNPDFNEAAFAGSGPWTVFADNDSNSDPGIASSDIAIGSTGTDLSLVGGTSVKVATVHYATSPGACQVRIENGRVYDSEGVIVLSCNPALAVESNCFGASISVLSSTPTDTPTDTPTSTPSAVPTATLTPTPVATETPTSTPTVTASATATNTSVPTTTSTPATGNTPKSTNTPKPTKTAKSTNTPKPTNTSKP